MGLRALAVLAALLVVWVGAAEAAFTTYTSEAIFSSAAGPTSAIDFEENASGDFTTYGSTATFGDVTFSDLNLATVDPDFSPDFYEWGSGDVLLTYDGAPASRPISASTPGGFYAFGVDLMTFDYGPVYGHGFTVRVNGIDHSVDTYTRPTRGFFGVISDVAITELIFTPDGGSFGVLDNFQYRLDPVPEPSSALLLGLIGLGAGLVARRRRSS